MGSFSIWHWIIVLVVVLILFGGRGKLSSLMGDMAKGITAFRKGLKDGEPADKDEPKTISTAGGVQANPPSSSPADGVRRDEAVRN